MIKIAQKFRPFSHVPGSKALLPLSSWCVEVFPALIRLSDKFKQIEIDTFVRGPVRNFVVMQDLERDSVRIFGRGKNKQIYFEITHRKKIISVNDRDFNVEESAMGKVGVERLSLGIFKKQNVEKIWERMDLGEILPIIYLLSQKIPGGSYVLGDLENEIFGGVSSIFFPEDRSKLCGLSLGEGDQSGRLQQIYDYVRGSIIYEEEDLHLLKGGVGPLSSGKIVGVEFDRFTINLHWKHGVPFKMEIFGKLSSLVRIICPKPISSFRLKRSSLDRGEIISVTSKISILEKDRCFLDNFRK